MSSAPERVVSSTLAAYGSQAVRVALRFATDVALARLLVPEAHGLFEYALSAVTIAGVLRDMGSSYQLIRDPHKPYGAALAWSFASGLGATALMVLLAPLFGGLDASLPAVVAALAPWLLFEAAATVPRAFFEREMRVQRLVLPEVLRGVVLALVAILGAGAGAGVWSLVAAELAGALLYAAWLFWRVRGELPLRPDWAAVPALLRGSAWLGLIALCAFTLPHFERYVLGPFVTTTGIAMYNKARAWGLRTTTLVVPAVQRVLYPALVSYRNDPERAFAAYRLGTVAILTFEVLAAYFLFANASLFQKVVLGPGWEEAVPLLRLLCLLPLVDPFTRFGGELLKAHHQDRVWLAVVALNLLSLVAFGLLLAPRWGAQGMAVANFLLLGNLLMTWRVAVICGRRLWTLVRDLVWVYLLPLPLFAGVLVLFPAEGWPRGGASLLAVALVVAGLAARFRGPFVAYLRSAPHEAAR